MSHTNWVQNERGGYFSNHITVSYLGEEKPKYHVVQNPDGDGWVLAVFYGFIGEYVPVEKDGEEINAFETSEEAKKYVDMIG